MLLLLVILRSVTAANNLSNARGAPGTVGTAPRHQYFARQERVRDFLDFEPARLFLLPAVDVVLHPLLDLLMDRFCVTTSVLEHNSKFRRILFVLQKKLARVLRSRLRPKESVQIAQIDGTEERDIQQQLQCKTAG